MNKKVPMLVVGGGIGGMSAAIALAKRGFQVELVEIDPKWGVYGAGITITGPTYRAFESLGALEDVLEFGYGARGGTRICTADGTVLTEVVSEPLGPSLPPLGGIMRPKLHELLSRRTRDAGVHVRLGVTYSECVNEGDHVRVTFTDGTAGKYSAVVVSDGAYSKSRGALLSDTTQPSYTGQYCWRLVAERPPEIDRGFVYIGGAVFAGLVPVSPTQMYMWLLEARAEKARVEPEQFPELLGRYMASFGGILGKLRDGLNSESIINCRPLEAIMLSRPWYRGRVMLIGDAAHSTTPHLASGAGIAVEDAVVLATLLADMDSIDEAFGRFMELRFERCRDVVESSVAIGSLQQSGASPAAYGALLAGAEHRLRQEIWTSPKERSDVAGSVRRSGQLV